MAFSQLLRPMDIFSQRDGHTEKGYVRRKALEGAFAAGIHEEATVTEALRFGNAGFAFGTYSFTLAGNNTKLGGNWNAVYVIDGDQVRPKLLAASVLPPPK